MINIKIYEKYIYIFQICEILSTFHQKFFQIIALLTNSIINVKKTKLNQFSYKAQKLKKRFLI